jgi:integrase
VESEFIELPLIDSTTQHRPTISCEAITTALEKSDDEQLRTLIVLLAASALRIKNVSADGTMLNIVEKIWRDNVDNFLKTKNGKRTVDLAPEVGEYLRKYIGDRKSGLVFQTRTGKPLNQANVMTRQLYPLLKELGITETGFHSFRRFRTTHLRKQRVPEGLVQWWLGHATRTQTDDYDMVREDVGYRTEVAFTAGFGFKIPAAVQTV